MSEAVMKTRIYDASGAEITHGLPQAEGDDPRVDQGPTVASESPATTSDETNNVQALTSVMDAQEQQAQTKAARQKFLHDRYGKMASAYYIKEVKDENGEMRVKVGMHAGKYAVRANDGYAQTRVQNGSRGIKANAFVHGKLRDAHSWIERRGSRDESKEQSPKTQITATLGGLAVGAAAKVASLKKGTKAKATVARRSIHDRIKTLNGQKQSDVTATKEMPAANTGKKPEDKPEQLTKRQKIRRAIGGVALVGGLLGLAGYAAYEADKNLAANSQEADARKVTSTDKDTTEQGTESATTDYPKVDVSAQIKHDAVPGDVVNNVVSTSKAERTLSLPDDGNIWNSSRAFLEEQGITPTDFNIDLVADAVRADKGLSEDDAEQLPVGYTFIVPADVLTQTK